MFGTLAVGWLATLAVVDLENATESHSSPASSCGYPTSLPASPSPGSTAVAGNRHAWSLVLIISLLAVCSCC